jgi:hypothetical protein
MDELFLHTKKIYENSFLPASQFKKQIPFNVLPQIGDISLNKPIYVPYNSLNNSGLLECYKCKYLEIDGKCYDKFLLGISNDSFFMDGIDCIINNSVMEGLR